MTAQAEERLIYKGEEIGMASQPLNQYLQNRSDIKFVSDSTACWRGYYGNWEISDDKLYLIGLDAFIVGYREVDLNYLFPNQNKVFADWFSGELRIRQGEMLEYVHMGYASLFEKDLILVIEKGILVNQYEVDNQAEYQRRLQQKEKDKIEQIVKETKKAKKDKISSIVAIILIAIVFAGICIGVYYLINLNTTLAYAISAIIVSGVILILGGVISLIVNKGKEKKKEDKTIAFIAINFLVLVFIGICIGLYYLIAWGTFLAYLIIASIASGLGYLIFIAIRNRIKDKRKK